MGNNTGFTLLEVSIVLVIIGLLVGGILVGRDLIEAARVRQEISQIQKIDTALNTFRLKYNAVPGDACTQAVAVGLSCYSGNDDGVLEDSLGRTVDYVSGQHEQVNEPLYFFYHLTQSNLLDDRFSCSPTMYQLTLNSSTAMLAGTHQGAIWLLLGLISNGAGGCNPNAIFGSFAPVMTPPQADAIDKKIDDGFANTGGVYPVVTGGDWTPTVDTTAASCVLDVTAKQYNVQNNTNKCALMVKMQ